MTNILFSSLTFAESIDSNQGVAVVVNGERVYTDTPAEIRNDRTLVPVRGIFEKMGADVQWDESTQKVSVSYKTKTIKLQIGNTTAVINNVAAKMDVAPVISNNRTLIPLRFISENIGMLVRWAPETRMAFITDPAYEGVLPEKTVLGFTTNDYKGDNFSYNSLAENYGSIDSIATFSYGFDENGNIQMTGESQAATVDLANKKGIKPLVLIHNYVGGQFNRDVSHQVLSDKAKRTKLINSILDVTTREGYEGVNIDIENVYWYDRQNYTDFIKELKQQMAARGYLTTLSIPAKDGDYATNSWNGAFDYVQLGQYADQILLMTYDEHYFGGEAGPIASLPWVERVMQYASQTIPSQKVLLGIGGYGYDWSSQGSRALPFSGIEELLASKNIIPSWDAASKSPYFTYYQDGIRHEVWYENAQSISIKTDLVIKYGLGGIGLWKLGYDNSELWDVINEKIG
ncbi:MAG: glycosyl hydrolase family 18 protein [Clostridiales bacterium]|nr:glycosyl hydrolase family 18 protein [Eubacteriales bacterium]MDH7565456.1 glycosyl hydrolase family 18 protein [Clostridiales bacterium]